MGSGFRVPGVGNVLTRDPPPIGAASFGHSDLRLGHLLGTPLDFVSMRRAGKVGSGDCSG